LVSGRAPAVSAAVTASTKGVGRLATIGGRFVPGVNIGIATLDAAKLVTTLADPNASTTEKVTATVSAFASGVAATNIPFVSQGAAVISTVSSLYGEFWG